MGWADAPEVSGQAAWMNAPEVGQSPPPPAHPSTLMDKVKNAVIAPEAERDPSRISAIVNGITGLPAEIVKQTGQAWDALKAHSAEAMNVDPNDPNLGIMPAGSGTGLPDLAGVAAAPVSGALTSLVGRPVEQQTGIRRQIVGDALSMAIPFGGEAKAGEELAKGTASIKPMAAEAHAAGYVLPPKMISDKPGIMANLFAGVSGKIKTAQAAAEKNQAVTNSIAAKDLGLPENTQLSGDVFDKVRADAGQAYEAVKTAIPDLSANDKYLEKVKGLGGANSDAAAHFPNTMKNQGITDLIDELSSVKQFPTSAGIELVKELRSSAVANLKAIGDRSKHMLGLAQRQAADAVDELIEDNIRAAGGDTGLVQEYKNARQTIAKSYDIEGATNEATGDVNAIGIGRLASKGKPVSGGMKTIANVAQAFPTAMKAGVVSEPMSALDFFGAAALAAHGNPKLAGMMLARPVARATILSKSAQNAFVNTAAGKSPNELANLSRLVLNKSRPAPAVNSLYQVGDQPQQ